MHMSIVIFCLIYGGCDSLKQKFKIALIILSPFLFCGILFSILGLVHHHADTTYFSIAVDNNENIYLGRIGAITVMNNSGELIREIEVGGTNGFAFNIIDDIIYMDSGKNVYAMDLYGNKLDIKISDEKNDQIHSRSKWHFKTASGTLYQLRNNHVYRDEGYGLELLY